MIVEPPAPDHEFSPEVRQVRDRPTETREPQPKKRDEDFEPWGHDRISQTL